MKRITQRAFSVAAAIAALGVIHLPSARAEEPGPDAKAMTGIWECNAPPPSVRPEIVSLQADGHVVIDAAEHIIIGTYRLELPRPGQGVIVITSERSDVRIGVPIRLQIKVNVDDTAMGIGFENDFPFKLDRLCHRMGAKP